MHDHELKITPELVLHLLSMQFPHLAKLPIVPISSHGTDHALFKLGDQYVIRLPRVEWTENSNKKNIDRECLWLPQLAECLSTPIASPIFRGNSTDFYPYDWTIIPWFNGSTPPFEKENEYQNLSSELAVFLNHFHDIPLKGDFLSRRGSALNTVQDETLNAIKQLTDDIDVKSALSLWEELVSLPQTNKNLVWVHGDFLPGNILVKDNKLTAVIDFSDLGMGNPACDLIIAWSLLNENSRENFKKHLKNIDEATWLQGKGWALSIALIMLPYYKNRSPNLVTLAKRILNNMQIETY